MKDSVIDDCGFDLGLLIREEMQKHQCDLLCVELDTAGATCERPTRISPGL
jgi:hypothetical protein